MRPWTVPPRWSGVLWAATTVGIFAGWFVVTRFSVTRQLRVWDVIAIRFGIGAVLLAPAVLRPGVRLPRGAWWKGLLFASLWGAPFVVVVGLGLQMTSAALAAAVTPTLMPVFAGTLAWLLWRQPQGATRWLGYGAILLGIAGMIVTAGEGLPNPLGILALASGSLMWAVYTMLFRGSGLRPFQAAALICLWSAGLFLPVYLGFGLSHLDRASGQEIAAQILYQGVVVSGLGIMTFNRAVAALGPSAATAIIALIPGTATLIAVPVLHEIPPLAEWVALAAVVAGALLAASPGRPSQPRPATPS